MLHPVIGSTARGSNGQATNEDWPIGDHDPGGYGYRAGGYYERGMPTREFNPYSPIAIDATDHGAAAPVQSPTGFAASGARLRRGNNAGC